MRKRKWMALSIVLAALVVLSGCTKMQSQMKDFKAETIGLARNFDVYDDYGNKTLSVSGNNTDMQPSDVENVLVITIDGSTWQHVGSTMVAAESGLENIVDTYELKTEIDTSGTGGFFTGLDRKVNSFVAGMTGLERVLIVKNQAGVIVGVYEGDRVLVENSELPNMTKILIDGKRLHVYRADFEILEQRMLK